MKLLFTTFLSLSLLAPASVRAQQAGAADTSPAISIARSGTQPSRQGPAANFTGSVRVDPLFESVPPSRAYGARVTFEAGARTAWHTHPLGQILIVTEGSGRVQQWGGPIDEIRPGDVVRIPPDVKHWHGASPDATMSHIALVELLDGRSTEWMEQVTNEQYGGPLRAQEPSGAPASPAAASGEPTAAQRLLGDIAPKLAELTDDVLFGDVWARPGLSPRDRSLVTVSALIAMNRPDQLRSHLARARENGLTEQQLVEAITHLAFYAGWPSAVTAVSVAREVLRED
jgi:4-carboxymuconolactone decarboxylase